MQKNSAECRQVEKKRRTQETDIQLTLNLDGTQQIKIDSGLGFLNHMLHQLAFHAGWDFNLKCSGDLAIDAHHSIEDIGIVLGQAVDGCLQPRVGLQRYACMYLPMDESLTRTVLDLAVRPYHVFKASLPNTQAVGQFPLEMVEHFFYSFAVNAKLCLHQQVLYSNNAHHLVESLFKGLAHAFKMASGFSDQGVSSTKGQL